MGTAVSPALGTCDGLHTPCCLQDFLNLSQIAPFCLSRPCRVSASCHKIFFLMGRLDPRAGWFNTRVSCPCSAGDLLLHSQGYPTRSCSWVQIYMVCPSFRVSSQRAQAVPRVTQDEVRTEQAARPHSYRGHACMSGSYTIL